MKKLRKIVSMAMIGLFALVPMINVDAKTEFTGDGWDDDGDTFGSVTIVDNNITNLKGNAVDTNGKYHGPYSHQSTETLANGISEEVNIELDPEAWAQGEYFSLSVSLNDSADAYVTETGIWVQKDGDAIYVYPIWDASNKIKVTEKGVYTFQYNFTKDVDANKVYFNFNLKLWDDIIGSVVNVDMDDPRLNASGETQTPVADHAVDVRSVWFTNIVVADGINVYTNLPENPSEEIPVEPVNPVEPATPVEEIKEEVANPETSDGILLFLGLTAVGIAGSVLTYRRLHN